MSTARSDPAASAAGAAGSPYIDPYEPEYPQSDGKPMADSTLQYQWIATIKDGLEALFADQGDVFVAGDLLWYATKNDKYDVVAPDVLVVFGRPKGHRRSYREWVEQGVAPQVVFEIDSPSNTATEMERKLGIYDRRGVEEYYYYDPESGKLEGWVREGDGLVPIADVEDWTSPRLGITFEAPPGKDLLVVRGPDGERFRTFVELSRDAAAAERLALQESKLRRRAERSAKSETRRADAEARRADDATRRADALTQRADDASRRADALTQRADEATRRADAQTRRADAEARCADAERRLREEADAATRAAVERAERMAALLREHGLDVD